MPMRGRSNSFGGTQRRGHPVIPKLGSTAGQDTDLIAHFDTIRDWISQYGVEQTRLWLYEKNFPKVHVDWIIKFAQNPGYGRTVAQISLTQGNDAAYEYLRSELRYPIPLIRTIFSYLEIPFLSDKGKVLGEEETPPTSPVYKEEDLQKVVHEEQGLVDNFELSGTDEEKLETLEIVMSELKKKIREFRSITDHLMRRFPEQEEDLKDSLADFKEKVRGHLEDMDAQRAELGAQERFDMYSSVSDGSSFHSLRESEKRYAKAKAEEENAQEMAQLEEEAILAKAEVDRIAIRKKELEKRTKAKVMEYQAQVERGSQPGSRVGSMIGPTDEVSSAPAMAVETLQDRLRRLLQDKPLENLPPTGSREGSVSHGSILGNRKGFYGREARMHARRDEGLSSPPKVTWQKAQDKSPLKALGHKTGPSASHMDPTARYLLRDKLLHQATDADVFNGDKSKFIGWLNRLTQDCDEIELSHSDCIRAFRARTKGKPREIVDRVADYSGKNAADALDEILKKLKAAVWLWARDC